MDASSPNEITRQLITWGNGDTAALEQLIAADEGAQILDISPHIWLLKLE